MPAGRPSKYRKEFCETLLIHAKSGLSFETFAAECSVDRDTLYEWAKKHKEFSDTKKRADAICQKWWERIGQAGLSGKIKGFNAAIWIFNMKNRFHWRDVHQIETTDHSKPTNKVYVTEWGNASESKTVKSTDDDA
jgi:hypothetical protein